MLNNIFHDGLKDAEVGFTANSTIQREIQSIFVVALLKVLVNSINAN